MVFNVQQIPFICFMGESLFLLQITGPKSSWMDTHALLYTFRHIMTHYPLPCTRFSMNLKATHCKGSRAYQQMTGPSLHERRERKKKCRRPCSPVVHVTCQPLDDTPIMMKLGINASKRPALQSRVPMTARHQPRPAPSTEPTAVQRPRAGDGD